MEDLSSPANGLSESPAANGSKIWSRWWFRVLLFLVHLGLLVAATSITPPDYAFQLGELLGQAMIIGSLFLWIFLWFARRRPTVLLFCGLALAQCSLLALVGMQFRKADKVLQEIEADRMQLQKTWETQFAKLHVEHALEILNGNDFHAEDLPGLRERVQAANAINTQYWAQVKASVNNAEKRLAAVNRKTAFNFRQGFESRRARNERVQELNGNYLTGIENLTTLLIDTKGRYRFTKAGLTFDRQQDSDAYNQELHSLNEIQAKIKAEQDSDTSQQTVLQ